jgi:hypothetical protein
VLRHLKLIWNRTCWVPGNLKEAWVHPRKRTCSDYGFAGEQFEEKQLGNLSSCDSRWGTGGFVRGGHAVHHTGPAEILPAFCTRNFQTDWKCRENVATRTRIPRRHW